MLPPAGRLYQVEYAIAAIQNAASAVGIVTKGGIVIATEKRVASKLLAPPKSSEKVYKLDEHVSVCVCERACLRVRVCASSYARALHTLVGTSMFPPSLSTTYPLLPPPGVCRGSRTDVRC